MMNLKIKRLSESAIMPIKATSGSAAIDLTAVEITQELNECGQLLLVYHTGLAMEIPEGYFGLLVPRSSISKKSLTLVTGASIIDSDYRGEITAKFRSTTDVVPSIMKPGERFAQLIILPLPEYKIEEVLELSETDRGVGGYGSTGYGSSDISAADNDQSSHETETIVTNSDIESEPAASTDGVLEQAQ